MEREFGMLMLLQVFRFLNMESISTRSRSISLKDLGHLLVRLSSRIKLESRALGNGVNDMAGVCARQECLRQLPIMHSKTILIGSQLTIVMQYPLRKRHML